MARPINPSDGSLPTLLAMMMEFDERRSEREEDRHLRKLAEAREEQKFKLALEDRKEKQYQDSIKAVEADPYLTDIQKRQKVRSLREKAGRGTVPVTDEERRAVKKESDATDIRTAFTKENLAKNPKGKAFEKQVNDILLKIPGIDTEAVLSLPFAQRVQMTKQILKKMSNASLSPLPGLGGPTIGEGFRGALGGIDEFEDQLLGGGQQPQQQQLSLEEQIRANEEANNYPGARGAIEGGIQQGLEAVKGFSPLDFFRK